MGARRSLLLGAFLLCLSAGGVVFAHPNGLGRFENDRGESAPGEDYGCPGSRWERLKASKQGHGPILPGETGDGNRRGDAAPGSSQCDASTLVNGLKTDLEIALSLSLSPEDHEAAQGMLREAEQTGDAVRRLKRFDDEWVRAGPSDLDEVKDLVKSLLKGDFKVAQALKTAVLPQTLGRGDFPSWYPPERYAADRQEATQLWDLRTRVWNLVRRTNR